MNWKIILQLSLFGLIMAFATVFLIPTRMEPFFWLAIFIFSAFVVAKVCTGKYFLHGLYTGLANCVWIIAVHIAFAKTYTARHLHMMTSMPSPFDKHPRLGMLIGGPIIGLISGAIIGLFCLLAVKILNKKVAA